MKLGSRHMFLKLRQADNIIKVLVRIEQGFEIENNIVDPDNLLIPKFCIIHMGIRSIKLHIQRIMKIKIPAAIGSAEALAAQALHAPRGRLPGQTVPQAAPRSSRLSSGQTLGGKRRAVLAQRIARRHGRAAASADAAGREEEESMKYRFMSS